MVGDDPSHKVFRSSQVGKSGKRLLEKKKGGWGWKKCRMLGKFNIAKEK